MSTLGRISSVVSQFDSTVFYRQVRFDIYYSGILRNFEEGGPNAHDARRDFEKLQQARNMGISEWNPAPFIGKP